MGLTVSAGVPSLTPPDGVGPSSYQTGFFWAFMVGVEGAGADARSAAMAG